MSRRTIKEEETTGVPEYMLTYGDMMTLLLCFFILLFAFSEIDAKKFEIIMESFKGSAGILRGGKTLDEDELVFKSDIEEKVTNDINELEDFKALKKIVEEHLINNNLEDQILVELKDKGLLLRFNDNVLYDSGKADLKSESMVTLNFLADLLKRNEFFDKHIRIEGHTDSDPIINSNKFPTNWELSSIRASNVVRFFIEETNMEGERFSVSGYSKYHPVVSNDTKENKAKNRRVDIVILRSNFLAIENN